MSRKTRGKKVCRQYNVYHKDLILRQHKHEIRIQIEF